MIFVTVGTNDFDALIAKVDELAPALSTEVVMQIGRGKYIPRHGAFFRFAESLDRYYDEAELIIAHGGLATIVEALQRGKKIVCVADPARYDCHQEQLLTVFAARNYLLWCRDLEHLEEAIQKAGIIEFAPYQPPECHIHKMIMEYLHRI